MDDLPVTKESVPGCRWILQGLEKVEEKFRFNIAGTAIPIITDKPVKSLVPISTVETLERMVSNYLRRWLGLPKSLSSIALCGHHNKTATALQILGEGIQGPKDIAEAIAGVEWAKWSRLSKQAITFVRAGEQPNRTKRTSAGILTFAREWQLLVDLERQLKFPNHIAATTM
ncbi:hypothetical protein N1851_020633 [Merluccius polli]|uniref:Uncharacterized protein n=1 Tax=Merluccius polli TaxID=89951 RepID=A0AA47MKD8_MERPO|nr:hypothetical protein N1851_020633 [Merluccius polli]